MIKSLVTVLLAVAGTSPILAQEDYAKEILGTWQCNQTITGKSEDGVNDIVREVSTIINYHADGVSTSVVSIEEKEEGIFFDDYFFMTVYGQSTWSVQGSTLVEKIVNNKLLSMFVGGFRITGEELQEVQAELDGAVKEEMDKSIGNLILHIGNEDMISKDIVSGEITTCSKLQSNIQPLQSRKTDRILTDL